MTGPLPSGHADVLNVYKDSAGEWRWRRLNRNRNQVASSGEGYEHRQHAIHMAEKLNPGCVLEVEPTTHA